MSHTHPPMSEMYPEGRSDVACTDLDEHHCIREMRQGDGTLARFVIAHDASWASPYRCEGSIPVTGSGRPVWSVAGSLAGGDLTLAPSVLDPDPACGGDHGWVRDGKWVSA